VNKRGRLQHQHPDAEQPQPGVADNEAWNSPAFGRSVLVSLAFVAAPAIVMVVLGERVWAAVWFGAGTVVIVCGSWKQVRSFWQWLRSGRRSDRE
jgi:hypothetical protein